MEIRNLKHDNVIKVNKGKLDENINILAEKYANEYQQYYYIPTLREQFNNEYAYFYKDIYSNHLVKIKPYEIEKRLDILREKVNTVGFNKCFYIGFKVPWYQ